MSVKGKSVLHPSWNLTVTLGKCRECQLVSPAKIHIHPKFQKVTVFGNQVLQIKLVKDLERKSPWI